MLVDILVMFAGVMFTAFRALIFLGAWGAAFIVVVAVAFSFTGKTVAQFFRRVTPLDKDERIGAIAWAAIGGVAWTFGWWLLELIDSLPGYSFGVMG